MRLNFHNISDTNYFLVLGTLLSALFFSDLFAQEYSADQLKVHPTNSRWLQYSSGKPFFLAAPGDPENFLYRGSLRSDGTRDGDQLQLIDKLKNTGANGIYLQAIRSHGGDGDFAHNPFIDHSPSKGLNHNILKQWDEWFSEMDANDIVIYFFFYDDSAIIWNTGHNVGLEERAFFEELVNRFEKYDNLIWVVAEEYGERYSPERISKLAEIIRQTDDFNHAIAVHKNHGLSFSDFKNDDNLDQFAMQYNTTNISELHNGVLQAWKKAEGCYNINMTEAAEWGKGADARKKAWAVAMAGAYVMVLGMDIANTAIADLEDLGRLRKFMEASDYYAKEPYDELGFAGTDYVLADPGDSYILYSANRGRRSLGLKAVEKADYRLRWLDIASGDTIILESVHVDSENILWKPPEKFGKEVALHIKRLYD